MSKSPSRPALLTRIVPIVVVVVGCSGSDEPSSASLSGERVACRHHHHLFGEPECRPESEFPRPNASDGMMVYEVTRYPDAEPTTEQRQAADDLIAQSFESARRNGWLDFDEGLSDGYHLLFEDSTHYVNEEYLFDDRVLDPDRPEFLMYYDTPTGKKLAGYMFTATSMDAEGPQIGGPLTVWHYHTWPRPYCLKRGMLPIGNPSRDGCEEGEEGHRSLEMLHVWLIDHPNGPFAPQMDLKPELVGELFEARGY